jgi:cytosine deaminase
MRILFRHTLLDDDTVDVRVSDHVVEAIAPAGSLTPLPGETVCEGGRVTPPTHEPHVHLDAALLGARAPNKSGTLREGIANWAVLREQLTADDVVERALTTARMYAGFGTLGIRTHVDTGSLLAVEAMVSVRRTLRDEGIDLQIVAFPQEGILRAPGRRAQWEAAVALGCDAVGVIPHFERTTEEGWESVRLAFDLAERAGVGVDLHCDETDDPGSRNLEVAAALTLDRGWGSRVVAGHCTALHSYPNPYAAKVIELVASSGMLVVTNPLDNVVLQGRYDSYPKRRGLTRVDQLWAAGAQVGIGHDSVMDPWYRLGTANLLDAAYMLVHVGQLTSEDDMGRAVRALWTENARPWSEAPLAEGGVARLLWWQEADLVEVLRTRLGPQRVLRGVTA